MNKLTRREAIKVAATAAAAGVAALGVPSPAQAQLIGDFWVYCPKCKKADKVSDVTENHFCSNDTDYRSVKDGEAIVECEKGHHPPGNKVSGVTKQHKCEEPVGDGVCGRQCEGCAAPPNANKK
jgi:hypothetical protein